MSPCKEISDWGGRISQVKWQFQWPPPLSWCSYHTCGWMPTNLFFESKSWPKLGGCIIYHWCSLLCLHPRFTSGSVLFFAAPKFWEKCPRSCQDLGTPDTRSERIFPHFHGVLTSYHSIKKTKKNKWSFVARVIRQNTQQCRVASCFARIEVYK